MPIKIAERVKSLHADLGPIMKKECMKDGANRNPVNFAFVIASCKEEFVRESGLDAYKRKLEQAISIMSYDEINKNTVHGQTLIMNFLAVSKDVDTLLTALAAMSRKGLALVNKKSTHSAYYFLRSMMVSMTTPRTEESKTALLPMMKPVIELTYNIDQLEEVKGGFEWHKETLNKKGDTSRDVAFDYMIKLLSKRVQYLKSANGILERGMFSSNFMGYAKKKIGKVQADDLRGMKASSQKENVKPVSANTFAATKACATTVRGHNQAPLNQGKRSTFVG